MSGRARPLSGIQRQVLSLYRNALRTARTKAPEERHTIEEYACNEMRRNKDIKKMDYMRIEHLIRKGFKQLDVIRMPEAGGVHFDTTSSPGHR